MVDFFDKIYTSIVSTNVFLDKIRLYSALRFLTRITANVVLPVYFGLTKHYSTCSLPTLTKKHHRLIVSLTTFPARINRLHLVIETLLRQTHKPDRIILWLSKEQFSSLDVLPKPLLAQQRRGLQIELCEGDLRSHKKYYYALMQYPEDILITMDDDIFYPTYTIRSLLEKAQQYPQAIIANYTHRMRYTDNRLSPYMQWDINIKEESADNNLFFGSGGGTLFPPHSLYADVTNLSIALSCCPKADDVWLNVMARLKQTPIIHTSFHSVFLPVINKHASALSTENMTAGNDVQIEAVRQYYTTNNHVDPFDINSHA